MRKRLWEKCHTGYSSVINYLFKSKILIKYKLIWIRIYLLINGIQITIWCHYVTWSYVWIAGLYVWRFSITSKNTFFAFGFIKVDVLQTTKATFNNQLCNWKNGKKSQGALLVYCFPLSCPFLGADKVLFDTLTHNAACHNYLRGFPFL